MVLSNAEKQANYRDRKRAREFMELTGFDDNGSVDDFIRAKEVELEALMDISGCQFNADILNYFQGELDNFDPVMASDDLDQDEIDAMGEDYEIYGTEALLEAWAGAELQIDAWKKNRSFR